MDVTNWKDADQFWTVEDRFSIFPPDTMNLDISKVINKPKVVKPLENVLAPEFKEYVKYILEQLIS